MNEFIVCVKLGAKNYFRVLGLREKFEVPDSLIEKKYLHKQDIIKESGNDFGEYALLNEAYYNIKDPMLRAKHIFELSNVINIYTTINFDQLLLMQTTEERKEYFNNCFSNMRLCFRNRNLIGAYRAWCACNILRTAMRM